jgi:hypothetical protein
MWLMASCYWMVQPTACAAQCDTAVVLPTFGACRMADKITKPLLLIHGEVGAVVLLTDSLWLGLVYFFLAKYLVTGPETGEVAV